MDLQKKIILIGGAPTVGKSTIAKAIARRFDIPFISGDQIREVMQSIADREKYPKLFAIDEFGPEDFFDKFSPQEISDAEYEQGETVWVGIKRLIDHDAMLTGTLIIEGVNILPHLVSRDYKGVDYIKSVFLHDSDSDRAHKVLKTRGLFDYANKYSDEYKLKEIEWISIYGDRIKVEAEEFGCTVINIEKEDSDIEKVIEALGLK